MHFLIYAVETYLWSIKNLAYMRKFISFKDSFSELSPLKIKSKVQTT